MTRDPVTPELAEIADAHGVATSFSDGTGTEVPIDAAVLRGVLALLEVDVSGPAAQRVALAHARERAAATTLPPTIGLRSDRSRPVPGRGRLRTEDGAVLDVDGELPAGLRPGRHLLETDAGRATVVVAPPRLPDPPRTWGWMVQLYALHSRRSWGIGDLGDLTDLVRGGHGAGAVLLNPLHAITPVPPVQPSPYTPSSRRYTTPLALRVTDLPAYAAADPATRAEVDALRPETTGDRIAHDRVWAAKRSALEALWRSAGRPDGRVHGPDDDDLTSFATFCALAERHGGRWSLWPEALRRPDGPGVAAARAELAPRVAFHSWVQRQTRDQLAGVRSAAREAGMPVGVIHDLAVGCDPEGADAWMLQDVLALDATVGAPPDAFNQRGQTWGLPPWRPDRLADTGYAAFGDMTRALLAHADGLRIDHVMGLWRLWWVPAGESADRGTYVHYDADAMLAVLLLEAHRADALVVGEDLGTVLPEIREQMAERNVLGSTVLWFARDPDPVTGGDDGPLRRPARWPGNAVATISTHDLPTAPGFLHGEQVRVRAGLGLLDDPDTEAARAAADRDELLALLAGEGLLDSPDVTDTDEIVAALHGLLAGSPSALVLASFHDVLGELRQPNLPGTVDEYPNWRIPLPVTLEEALADPRVRRVARVLSGRG